MKRAQTIYQNGNHRWIIIARDPEKPDYLIDTNEYLICSGEQALLTDPGGMEIFPQVFSAISRQYNPRNIQAIFSSHQDPDIISSLGLWLDFNPDIKCHISRLWTSFIPHFGGDANTLCGIPDEGAEIRVGLLNLQAVPAHYLHSSGNFNLYDPAARILFSADIGAALLPPEASGIFVEDFDKHIRHAEGFHRRWMGSSRARDIWCERISRLDIDMLCPQHGAIYQGADIQRFINWFSELDIGSGNI